MLLTESTVEFREPLNRNFSTSNEFLEVKSKNGDIVEIELEICSIRNKTFIRLYQHDRKNKSKKRTKNKNKGANGKKKAKKSKLLNKKGVKTYGTPKLLLPSGEDMNLKPEERAKTLIKKGDEVVRKHLAKRLFATQYSKVALLLLQMEVTLVDLHPTLKITNDLRLLKNDIQNIYLALTKTKKPTK